MVKKERSRRGGYGADDAGGGGGGNPSRRRYHGQSNRSGKQSRHISYIDKLKSGEKELRNYIDAEQFFKNLSKDALSRDIPLVRLPSFDIHNFCYCCYCSLVY